MTTEHLRYPIRRVCDAAAKQKCLFEMLDNPVVRIMTPQVKLVLVLGLQSLCFPIGLYET
jgi:hypothetical protein